MPRRMLTIVQPSGAITVEIIDAKQSYDRTHAVLGGPLEGVKVRYHGKIRQGYVHESGILYELEPNICATRLYCMVSPYYAASKTVLHGPLVISQPFHPKP